MGDVRDRRAFADHGGSYLDRSFLGHGVIFGGVRVCRLYSRPASGRSAIMSVWNKRWQPKADGWTVIGD